MKGYLCIACFISALFILVPVHAQPTPPQARVDRVFSVHDHDLDGSLNREEFAEIGKKRKDNKPDGRGKNVSKPPLQFNQVDKDNNGLVSEHELIDALNRRLEQHRQKRFKGQRY